MRETRAMTGRWSTRPPRCQWHPLGARYNQRRERGRCYTATRAPKFRNLAALQSNNTLKAEADRGTPLSVHRRWATVTSNTARRSASNEGCARVGQHLMAAGVDMCCVGELLGGEAQTHTCSPFPSAWVYRPGRACYTRL